MGLKPYDRTISQIFNNIQYDVDFYQREYKWNDKLGYKPVSSLIKDIFYRFDLEKYNPNQEIKADYVASLEWYFLNSFLTNSIKGKKYIVDGQQRLTTLTLILIALYHLSRIFKLPTHVTDKVKSLIVGNTEYGLNFWMGFRDRKSALEDIFNNNLSFKEKPKNVSEKNIYENYNVLFTLLKNKFTNHHRLHMFIAYFNERILLIETEIDKDKDVAMVFEVINDRGVPLKPYEILKGKLLSQIEIGDRGKYIKIWEDQINKLYDMGENHIDSFFSLYFRSKYSFSTEKYQLLEQSRYHKSIFIEEFDNIIQLKDNEANVRKFVEKILPYYVTVYHNMIDYSNNYFSEFKNIYFNTLNDQNGQYVLTLSAIELCDENREEKLKRVPEQFDRLFSLLNLMNSYKANEFNNIVIRLLPQIKEKRIAEIIDIFFEALTSNICKNYDIPIQTLDSPYRYDFFKNVGYNTLTARFLRYFFARIDHYISDSSDLPKFGSYYQLIVQTKGKDKYHIEHIITNNEKNIALFEDENDFNIQRNRLGGLLLLKGRDNESSGDELYEEKKKTYNVVGTYYAKTLLDDMYHKKVSFVNFSKQIGFRPINTYGKNEIEERHNLLFKLIKLIWQ